MKERHEKETALKAERNVLAKDAANKQAADLVSYDDIYNQHFVAPYMTLRPLSAHGSIQIALHQVCVAKYALEACTS